MLQSHQPNSIDRHIEAMRSLVEGIILALVDSREDVDVSAVAADCGTVLVVRAAPGDVGKIIGKQGRTATSLRTILSASSMKLGHRFSLNVRIPVRPPPLLCFMQSAPETIKGEVQRSKEAVTDS